jgi:hypothetical protein
VIGGPPSGVGCTKSLNRMCVPAVVADPHDCGLLAQSAITAVTK